MSYSHSPLDHLIFLSVIMVNYIGVKINFSGFVDVVDLLFVLPLKLLPFITAYLAYKKQIRELFNKLKNYINKRVK